MNVDVVAEGQAEITDTALAATLAARAGLNPQRQLKVLISIFRGIS
jgi:hypothetical protein